MSKPKLVQRACCGTGLSRRRGYVSPPEATVAYDLASTNGPVIAEIEEAAIDRSTGTHEAAHAVIAHGFGQRIATVSAAPPARVIYASHFTSSPVERISILWAAPAAEAAALNRRITLSLFDESDYLRQVCAFEFGGCDECQMALVAWTANGLDAGIEAARAVFREGQLLALRLLDRRDVRAASFNEKDNSVEVVWTTGTAVRRFDWRTDRFYSEVLVVTPAAVRLDRLNSGAPFLNAHSDSDLRDVIGSVVPGSAKLKGGKGIARVRLSNASSDADIVSKIRDGIIRNVSVDAKNASASRVSSNLRFNSATAATARSSASFALVASSSAARISEKAAR